MMDVHLSIDIIYHFDYNVTFLVTPHILSIEELHIQPHLATVYNYNTLLQCNLSL